jgi:hypothetical protein
MEKLEKISIITHRPPTPKSDQGKREKKCRSAHAPHMVNAKGEPSSSYTIPLLQSKQSFHENSDRTAGPPEAAKNFPFAPFER